jgi:chromosome segregation ATPase
MSDTGRSVDLIFNLKSEGKFDEAQAEINKLEKEALDLNAAGQKAYDTLLKLGKEPTRFADAANDARNAARAITEMATAQEKLSNTGAGLASDPQKFLANIEAQKKAAQEVVQSLIQIPAEIQKRIATMVGQFTGIGGLGGAFGAGGAAGGAMALGLAGIDKGIELIVEKFKQLEDRLSATAELSGALQQTQTFNPAYLADLEKAAEHLSDANHKTEEWLKTLAELHRKGADEKTIGALSIQVKELAKLMGGDLKRATAEVTAELEGNFEGLRKLGIVIDETQTHSEALAEAQRQVALRSTEMGNAAESSASGLRELKIAAELSASAISEITKESNAATTALDKTLAAIKRNKAEADHALGKKESADVAEIQADVAEGKMSKAEGDKRIAALRQKKRRRKIRH